MSRNMCIDFRLYPRNGQGYRFISSLRHMEILPQRLQFSNFFAGTHKCTLLLVYLSVVTTIIKLKFLLCALFTSHFFSE